jgi:hypothetical protein
MAEEYNTCRFKGAQSFTANASYKIDKPLSFLSGVLAD